MNHKIKLKGVLKLLLRWPVLLSVLFAVMDVQLFLYNIKAGLIGLFYLVVYIIVCLVIIMAGKRRLQRELIEFAANYGQLQMEIVENLAVPYAILNEDGHLLWGNLR